MKFLYLFFLSIFSYSVFAQLPLPYGEQFENGLPSSWSATNFWNYEASLGVANSGGMAARDHTFIGSESVLITPYFVTENLTSLSLEFNVLMGRFEDSQSSLVILADYGNGWIPLVGLGEDTGFYFSVYYPQIFKIKTAPNLYWSNTSSTQWTPANGQANYQTANFNLDSLLGKGPVRFKFLVHFYYGGLVFIDNFSINGGINGITNNIADSQFKIYPNPSSVLIFIEYDQPAEVSIYNNLGQFLFSEKIVKDKGIDVSSLPCGLYYSKVTDLNSSKSISRSFIISK